MDASRFPVRRSAGLAAIGGVAALLSMTLPTVIDVRLPQASDVSAQVAEMRRSLPMNLSDGSVLDAIDWNGTRLTLSLVVDDRVPLAAVRDGDRDRKCEVWRTALRDRSLSSIEYRYLQTGATSSVFLDRTVCG